ncbi:MAG: radical SAM protein [Candidatus Sumerlaeota bacterium]|nr:radical SAM protein [Candidatus Sumerlaeota bacterium]
MKRSVIIRRKLNSLARRLGWTWAPARPVQAWISPTTVCNLNCRTCGRFISHAKFQHMSAETYQIVRREIMPALGSVILTGVGEPLLAPLLPEMIADCRRYDIRPELTTNGMIWNEEIFGEIAALGGRVALSVDGADKETMEYVRRGLNYETFLKTAEGLARLKRGARESGFGARDSGLGAWGSGLGTRNSELGTRNSTFEFYLNVVLLRMNLGQLGAIVNQAAQWGVDCIYFSNFGATDSPDKDFIQQSLETRPDIVNPVLDKVCAQCEAKGIRFSRPQFLSGAEGETKRAQGAVPSSEFRVPSSKDQVPSSEFRVPSSKDQVPSAEFRVPSPESRTPNHESQIPNPEPRTPNPGRLLQCALPWWAIYIEADGSVFPCCQWWPPIANLRDAPFARIWNSAAYREIRRTVNRTPLPGACRRCILGERRF